VSAGHLAFPVGPRTGSFLVLTGWFAR
jgi:hypothetical protein